MYMLVCACISFTVDDIFLWMTNKIHAYTYRDIFEVR